MNLEVNVRIVRFMDEKGQRHWGQDLGDGRAELAWGHLFDEFELTGQRVLISRRLAAVSPVNIFCVGLNYRGHAQEMNAAMPARPVIFMKPTSTLNHPGGPIRIPDCCTHGPEIDYEGELAVVIGKTARNVPEDRALEFVFGYTCANDVSARRWQKSDPSGQWIRGKSFDTFCPLGPVLVTADEIPDPQALRIRTTINGQVMQDQVTGDMIFTVARLISFLSQDTTLLPGTVILTGTPGGVGFTRKPPVFLRSGDEVVVEIDKIGRLVNFVEAA